MGSSIPAFTGLFTEILKIGTVTHFQFAIVNPEVGCNHYFECSAKITDLIILEF